MKFYSVISEGRKATVMKKCCCDIECFLCAFSSQSRLMRFRPLLLRATDRSGSTQNCFYPGE